MTSVEKDGIYSLAFRFATIVTLVSFAFWQAWSPIAIEIRTDSPNGYRQIYTEVLLLLLCVILAVGGALALFSSELINLLMPDKYNKSAVPLTIICFGVVLQATQQVTAVGVSLEKKTIFFVRLAWITAIINFILNWPFIPRFGSTVAAWVTMLSYLILTGSYLYFNQRLYPLSIP